MDAGKIPREWVPPKWYKGNIESLSFKELQDKAKTATLLLFNAPFRREVMERRGEAGRWLETAAKIKLLGLTAIKGDPFVTIEVAKGEKEKIENGKLKFEGEPLLVLQPGEEVWRITKVPLVAPAWALHQALQKYGEIRRLSPVKEGGFKGGKWLCQILPKAETPPQRTVVICGAKLSATPVTRGRPQKRAHEEGESSGGPKKKPTGAQRRGAKKSRMAQQEKEGKQEGPEDLAEATTRDPDQEGEAMETPGPEDQETP